MRRQVAADYLCPPAEDRAGRGGQRPALFVQEAAYRRGEGLRVVPRQMGRKPRPGRLPARAAGAADAAGADSPGGP